MKQTDLTRAIDEVVALKIRAVDQVIEELVEPLLDLGSPEKIIGKPYESWSEQDFMLLSQVYGEEPNALSNLIFRKKYAEVKELEAGELDGMGTSISTS